MIRSPTLCTSVPPIICTPSTASPRCRPARTCSAKSQWRPIPTNAEQMIEAATKAGRVGAIAYTYRGYPLVEVLRRKVAEEAFGPLRRIGGCYLSQDVLAADKYVWLFTPGTTGGSYALMDLGIHWLDLVEYVAGSQIREITAQFSTHQQERIWRGGAGEGPRPPGSATSDGGVTITTPLEDQADLLIRLDNGAAGSMTVSGLAPGHPNTIILSADGSAGWFRLEPTGTQHPSASNSFRQHHRAARSRGFARRQHMDVHTAGGACRRLHRCFPQRRVSRLVGDAGPGHALSVIRRWCPRHSAGRGRDPQRHRSPHRSQSASAAATTGSRIPGSSPIR